MKNKSNNIDEEERRPKQLKSNLNDGNNDKPNKGKINSSYKDNNSNNNNNIFDEDEEPSPEPEPSHHGDPRHHAFHSCKTGNPFRDGTHVYFQGCFRKLIQK